ncbi:MAG: DUF1573 domain-containing protein, partial [Rhizobiales bacterium]|nr:DUF1573 domain-containing protein [Hyphomicrobiales bacterium]
GRAVKGVTVDQPSLVVESSESSLKASDDIATGEFKLTNRGATPVKIIDITPNCSCAEVVASARTIPVGGFVKIHVGIRMDGTWLHVGTPEAIREAEMSVSESAA